MTITNTKRLWIFYLFIIICSSELKVGFLFPGSINDFGFNYQNYVGILDLQAAFPDITTNFTENVSIANCISTAQTYLNSGFDVLFFLNAPFVACAQNISISWPTKNFIVHNIGEVYPGIPNLSAETRIGFGPARFIVSVLAAKQEGTSKICLMVPKIFAFKERTANYALLGIRYVDPNDELIVGLTLNFDDPDTETIVADYFISVGCDVTMIQGINSIRPLVTISDANRWGIGYASDMQDYVGERVLTSIVVDPGLGYIYFVDKILSETFISEVLIHTLQNGGIAIADSSSQVTSAAKHLTNSVERKVTNGQLNPLCQPLIKDIFGTNCVSEAQISVSYFPGITVFDGTI